MKRDEFIQLLERLNAEQFIGVYEDTVMTEPDGTPRMDEYGGQMVRDVVVVGDGRLYIERDDNEPDSEQAIIDLLSNIYDYIGTMLDALKAEA